MGSEWLFFGEIWISLGLMEFGGAGVLLEDMAGVCEGFRLCEV